VFLVNGFENGHSFYCLRTLLCKTLLIFFNDYIYHAHARSICSHKVLLTVHKLHMLRWHIF